MVRIALLTIAICAMAGAAVAQEAVPETPPELRDFRLDPAPRTETQPAPAVEPPPVAPTVEPQPQPSPPRREPPVPTRPAAERPAAQTEDDETPAETGSPAATEQAVAEPVTPPIDLPDTDEPITKSLPDTAPIESPTGDNWLPILAALAAALALLGAFVIWRRRKRSEVPAQDPVATKPVEAASPPPPPIAQPVQPLKTEPVAPPAKRPLITLAFTPAKATLGFSSMTLKGRLLISNEGDVSARDLQLRSTMISANQRQAAIIAAFDNGSILIDPNPIGDAGPGEQLALEIEMAVPINDIESFTVGDKHIFVPLILANVAYAWDGGNDSVTLACMVGRESDPPQSKMAPLRLDLGPRSFAPLGQRPVYA